MWRRQGRDCFRGVRCDSPDPLKLCGAREHRGALATLNFSGNANKNLAWQTVRAWGDNVKVSAPPWPTPYIISQGSILPIKVCRAVSPWLGSQPTVALTSKSKAATYKLCRHPCLHVCTLPLLHTGNWRARAHDSELAGMEARGDQSLVSREALQTVFPSVWLRLLTFQHWH